ncbi:MAG: ribosome recycling factor [Clostridia bacterium]|nr:ribosome recycling factor [Clostridia bacterium]
MIEEVKNSCKEDCAKAVEHQVQEYLVVRAGRANPHILDKVTIDYYGVPTPIKNMASISVPEARILAISVWDQSQHKNVVKAITEANLGVNPNEDGKTIRLIFPPLTEERRREIVKQIKKIAEDTKVAVRNARRDAMDMIKDLQKDGEISEDEQARCEDEIQKMINSYTAEIDAKFEAKEKEIMEV